MYIYKKRQAPVREIFKNRISENLDVGISWVGSTLYMISNNIGKNAVQMKYI